MTTTARLVLLDCKSALQVMHSEVTPSEWRRQLVALLTLLRAVGHVLDKVDAERNPRLRFHVQAWWSSVKTNKSSHPHFWEFIERERNSFVKEYQTVARQVVVGHVGAVIYDSAADTYSSDAYVPPKYTPKLVSGYFAGQDFQQVAGDAIRWWEQQLSQVDAASSSAH